MAWRSMSVSLRNLVDVGAQFLQPARVGQLLGQRRVGGHHEERGPVQGVGTGGEHRDRLIAALDREGHFGALGAADPVALHEQDALGPVPLQGLRVGQQLVGVGGDPEVPLGQRPADDLGAAALAPAVDDLLVGQHGLVLRAPVDVTVLAVGQLALVEPQEQPLVPLVVLRIAGRQPARPVEGDRVPAERFRLRLDVRVRPVGGVRVVADRRVLGGQAEGVPADRVQHVAVELEPVPRDGVADRVGLGVPHVQVTGRIGEHIEQVSALAGIRRVVAGTERIQFRPAGQPLFLDSAWVVALRRLGALRRCHGFLTLLGLATCVSRLMCPRYGRPWE